MKLYPVCVPILFRLLRFPFGRAEFSNETESGNSTSTSTTTESQTTTDYCGPNGQNINGICFCSDHWAGLRCDQVICDYGSTTGIDGQFCSCWHPYYGTYCSHKCDHGSWITITGQDAGWCRCSSGWEGMNCDRSTHDDGYPTYTASIIFLCLAAFLVIACVLCVANRRRQREITTRHTIEFAERGRYGSFSEGHDNPAHTISADQIGTLIISQPLPKYEDALKMPVYVAPVNGQNRPGTTTAQGESTAIDQQEPPPYSEIITVARLVDAQNRSATIPVDRSSNENPQSEAHTRIVEDEDTLPATIHPSNHSQLNTA